MEHRWIATMGIVTLKIDVLDTWALPAPEIWTAWPTSSVVQTECVEVAVPSASVAMKAVSQVGAQKNWVLKKRVCASLPQPKGCQRDGVALPAVIVKAGTATAIFSSATSVSLWRRVRLLGCVRNEMEPRTTIRKNEEEK